MNKTYTIIKTSRFKRDYKRLMKQGRDMTYLLGPVRIRI